MLETQIVIDFFTLDPSLLLHNGISQGRNPTQTGSSIMFYIGLTYEGGLDVISSNCLVFLGFDWPLLSEAGNRNCLS